MRSGRAVLRLRLVDDVFSEIVLRNPVNLTILIANYKKKLQKQTVGTFWI